jgi:hypothetical protein
MEKLAYFCCGNESEDSVISLDLHKPADFIHTGYTKQEKAVNSPHIAYSGNFV